MKILFLLLTIEFLSPLTGFAKVTNSCDCPNGDTVKVNDTNSPEPKNLKKQIFPGKACSTSGVTGAASSFHALTRTVEEMKTPSDLKKPKEVLDYMSCYRKSDETFCHFKNTLAPHIALAAESSGLPFAVQACLYFQESKFDPDAQSNIPSGKFHTVSKKNSKGKVVKFQEEIIEHANGYIQFMDDTMNDIEPVISGEMKAWEEGIADAEDNIKIEESKLKKQISMASKKLAKTNIRYYETRITVWEAKIEARKVWDTYWKDTKNVPKNVTQADVKDPKVAFALSMTKQTYDLALMDYVNYKYNKSKYLQINRMKTSDSAILLAAAYNVGRAGLASKCGKVKSLGQCFSKYKKGNETWIHMSAIKRCSAKGSTESTIWDYKKEQFVAKKSCKGFECK